MENNEYKIVISEKAKQMLGMHFKFMSSVSKELAEAKKNELIVVISSLKNMAGRFPFFDAEFIPKNKYHKMFIEKYYLVLYQIKDDIVHIDYILDCRKDYSWLIN